MIIEKIIPYSKNITYDYIKYIRKEKLKKSMKIDDKLYCIKTKKTSFLKTKPIT